MTEEKKVFAKGYNLYKIFWIFLIGSLVGDIVETIFCFFALGSWMSRSSLIYGRLSVVWGFGAVFLTISLHKLRNRNDRYIFVVGSILGGGYEYVCSLFTEYVLHSKFWDYSDMPFNIRGRVNLLFCLFWGILALMWVKEIYPRLSKLIERIPVAIGKSLTIVLLVLLLCDVVISVGAIARYTERAKGIEPTGAIETFVDKTYDNQRIHRVYPKLNLIDNEENK